MIFMQRRGLMWKLGFLGAYCGSVITLLGDEDQNAVTLYSTMRSISELLMHRNVRFNDVSQRVDSSAPKKYPWHANGTYWWMRARVPDTDSGATAKNQGILDYFPHTTEDLRAETPGDPVLLSVEIDRRFREAVSTLFPSEAKGLLERWDAHAGVAELYERALSKHSQYGVDLNIANDTYPEIILQYISMYERYELQKNSLNTLKSALLEALMMEGVGKNVLPDLLMRVHIAFESGIMKGDDKDYQNIQAACARIASDYPQLSKAVASYASYYASQARKQAPREPATGVQTLPLLDTANLTTIYRWIVEHNKEGERASSAAATCLFYLMLLDLIMCDTPEQWSAWKVRYERCMRWEGNCSQKWKPLSLLLGEYKEEYKTLDLQNMSQGLAFIHSRRMNREMNLDAELTAFQKFVDVVCNSSFNVPQTFAIVSDVDKRNELRSIIHAAVLYRCIQDVEDHAQLFSRSFLQGSDETGALYLDFLSALCIRVAFSESIQTSVRHPLKTSSSETVTPNYDATIKWYSDWSGHVRRTQEADIRLLYMINRLAGEKIKSAEVAASGRDAATLVKDSELFLDFVAVEAVRFFMDFAPEGERLLDLSVWKHKKTVETMITMLAISLQLDGIAKDLRVVFDCLGKSAVDKQPIFRSVVQRYADGSLEQLLLFTLVTGITQSQALALLPYSEKENCSTKAGKTRRSATMLSPGALYMILPYLTEPDRCRLIQKRRFEDAYATYIKPAGASNKSSSNTLPIFMWDIYFRNAFLHYILLASGGDSKIKIRAAMALLYITHAALTSGILENVHTLLQKSIEKILQESGLDTKSMTLPSFSSVALLLDAHAYCFSSHNVCAQGIATELLRVSFPSKKGAFIDEVSHLLLLGALKMGSLEEFIRAVLAQSDRSLVIFQPKKSGQPLINGFQAYMLCIHAKNTYESLIEGTSSVLNAGGNDIFVNQLRHYKKLMKGLGYEGLATFYHEYAEDYSKYAAEIVKRRVVVEEMLSRAEEIVSKRPFNPASWGTFTDAVSSCVTVEKNKEQLIRDIGSFTVSRWNRVAEAFALIESYWKGIMDSSDILLTYQGNQGNISAIPGYDASTLNSAWLDIYKDIVATKMKDIPSLGDVKQKGSSSKEVEVIVTSINRLFSKEDPKVICNLLREYKSLNRDGWDVLQGYVKHQKFDKNIMDWWGGFTWQD